jgi:hypothetical protein
MQNILPKLLALGLLGGGFTATGDLGWLARRGMRLLEASTVPAESAVESTAGNLPAQDSSGRGGMPSDTLPGMAAGGRAVGPPSGGPTAIDLATLAAGERVVVWVVPPSRRGAEPVTLDLIDPASGAVLLHRAGEPPRRVRVVSGSVGILGSRDGVSPALAVRALLLVQPLGLAHGMAGQTEACGRIVAFAPAFEAASNTAFEAASNTAFEAAGNTAL